MRMMETLGRAALGLVAIILMSVAPARAVDTVIIGTVGSPSANLWPLFIGIDRSDLYPRKRQRDPATRGGLARHVILHPLGGSDPGPRARRRARHRALRNPGATLCVDREIEHQEPQRSQGQSDLGRRPEGHHSPLCRSYAGAERAQDRRL